MERFFHYFTRSIALNYGILFIALLGIILAYRWISRPAPREGLLCFLLLSICPLIIGALGTIWLYQHLFFTSGVADVVSISERLHSTFLPFYLGAGSTVTLVCLFFIILTKNLNGAPVTSLRRGYFRRFLSLGKRSLFSPLTIAFTIGINLLFVGCYWMADRGPDPAFAILFIPMTVFAPQIILESLFTDCYWHLRFLWDGPNPLIAWKTFLYLWYFLLSLPASYFYGLLIRIYITSKVSNHIEKDAQQ